MDRRVFLLLTLAGAADPALLQPPALAPTSGGQTYGPLDAPTVATDQALFEAWRAEFMVRAIAQGLPAEVVTREFDALTPDPRVLALQNHQPEFSKPVGDYVRGVVSDARVAQGRQKLAGLAWLPDVEARFGVAAEVLVAVWAVETNFGALQGDFDVLRSLATLAALGGRQEWAEGQLIAVLQIIASGEANRQQMHGSWSGALGQTQFEPSQYLSTAVDGDGDGRRDLWNSSADALASAANLLAKAGWRRGERWQREVLIPAGFDYSLTEGAPQPLAFWTGLGVRSADGELWSADDRLAGGVLLCPSGATGPAFLALPNHFVLRQYNNSLAYALAVVLLADRIVGRPPLTTPWPAETPLSLTDRSAAQAALLRLGFDPGGVDGLVGAKTRSALRAWQKQQGLPSDGYLSPTIVQRLTTQAAAAPATR